jgi:hypothetical protein
MALGKQAKTLSKGQIEAVLAYLAKTRWKFAFGSEAEMSRTNLPRRTSDDRSALMPAENVVVRTVESI